MSSYIEIKEAIIGEKLEIITTWIAKVSDVESRTIDSSILLSTGVLSEQSKLFLSFDERYISTSPIEIPIARLLIADAIRKEFEYLITPQSFLTNYLANEEQSSIRAKLSTLHTYEYYRIILSAIATDGNMTQSIADIVKDIDDLLMTHATISTIIELLDEIYAFIRFRGSDPAVETELLVEYFNDKHMLMVSHAIASSNVRVMTLQQTIDIISTLLVTSPSQEIPLIRSNHPKQDFTKINVEQYDDFVEELKNVGVTISKPHDIPQNNGILPFEYFLTQDCQDRILKKIFYGHRKQYKSFIDTINASSSLDVALLNVDTTLELQRVKKTSKSVRKLYEAIEKRYS